MSTESAIKPSHPLLPASPPLLLPPSIFPSITVFSNESILHIRWPKYWNFSFSISPSNEYSGLISFRINWFDGHEFEQAPGVGDEQGSLVYCNPWGWKELNTTEQLNWTELRVISGHGIDFHFLIMNCKHDCEIQFIHCIPPIEKFWAKKTVKLGRGRSWTKIGSQRSPELDYSGQSWHSTWLYLRIRCPCAGNSAGGTTPPSWRCM